jgi:UMF1 family MFS transporter
VSRPGEDSERGAGQLGDRDEQRAWSWYDWANSAYVTTTGTVLFAPYLTSIAERAACGDVADCGRDLSVLGLPVSPGSLAFYVITVTTVLSALVLPVVGAAADRSPSKRRLLARYAWVGAAAATAMVLVAGTNWQLGAGLLLVANVSLACSLVVNDAILCDVAGPDERDRVSSRAWAFGYLGGGLLLAAELALVVYAEQPGGLSTGWAVRICLAGAGLWWAGFTVIPYRRLRDRPPRAAPDGHEVPRGDLVRASFRQLATTLRDVRHYPMALTFLLAYLFYNDGIQTVIVAAAVYGQEELGFSRSVLLALTLVVQFVAFAGALLFGRVAARLGKRTILAGLFGWVAIVGLAFVLPAGMLAPFLALGVAIGVVLGGTQALSRSFFSQLVPRGREAEYFSLYQACERGTSWLGTLVFGLIYQLTGSYRPAILALVVFFVVGLALLVRVDARLGIAQAGNEQPRVV